MKLILENWREYSSHQEEASLLVEQIWSGSLVNEIVLLEHQQAMLEEGIDTFFNSAFNAVKGKIDDFTEWKDQKLMSFINGAIKKIQDFFVKMGEIALKTKDKILQKLFPLQMIRKMLLGLQVFQGKKYLKAGAAILSVLLQKLAELGAQAVLDALSGGAATAVKIADFVNKNVERIKMFVESVKAALDPNGILKILDNIKAFKEIPELLTDLRDELKRASASAVAGLQGKTYADL